MNEIRLMGLACMLAWSTYCYVGALELSASISQDSDWQLGLRAGIDGLYGQNIFAWYNHIGKLDQAMVDEPRGGITVGGFSVGMLSLAEEGRFSVFGPEALAALAGQSIRGGRNLSFAENRPEASGTLRGMVFEPGDEGGFRGFYLGLQDYDGQASLYGGGWLFGAKTENRLGIMVLAATRNTADTLPDDWWLETDDVPAPVLGGPALAFSLAGTPGISARGAIQCTGAYSTGLAPGAWGQIDFEGREFKLPLSWQLAGAWVATDWYGLSGLRPRLVNACEARFRLSLPSAWYLGLGASWERERAVALGRVEGSVLVETRAGGMAVKASAGLTQDLDVASETGPVLDWGISWGCEQDGWRWTLAAQGESMEQNSTQNFRASLGFGLEECRAGARTCFSLGDGKVAVSAGLNISWRDFLELQGGFEDWGLANPVGEANQSPLWLWKISLRLVI